MAKLRALWCRIRGYHRSYYRMPPAGCCPTPFQSQTITWDVASFEQGLPCTDCGKEQPKPPIVRVVLQNHKPYKWEEIGGA